jgi:hypothetical protein
MPAKPKTYPRLQREATALDTPAARLVALTSHPSITVSRWAQANPSLLTERLIELLRCGKPAAWDNPSAWTALLGMPPSDVWDGAVECVCELARLRKGNLSLGAEDTPYPVSDGMRALLRDPLLSGWECATTPGILKATVSYAMACGHLSRQHHASTLIGCLALRAATKSDPYHKKMLAFAESFAWSGTTDSLVAGKLFDRAHDLGALAEHALVFYPRWHERYDSGLFARPDVADFLRWVMPTPPWLEVLDG